MIELKNAEPNKNSTLKSDKKIEIEKINNYLDSTILGYNKFIDKIEKEKDTEFITEDKPVPPYKHLNFSYIKNAIPVQRFPCLHNHRNKEMKLILKVTILSILN